MLYKRKWVIVTLLLVIILHVQAVIIDTSGYSEYTPFEMMGIIEGHCDYVNGSWVATLELVNSGEGVVSIDRITTQAHEHNAEEIQVFNVTFIDYCGDIRTCLTNGAKFGNQTPIVLSESKPSPKAYGTIQFEVPKEVCSGDVVLVLLRGASGCDYAKILRLEMNTPVSVDSLAETMDGDYVFRTTIEALRKQMPLISLIFLIFCWLGVVLYYMDVNSLKQVQKNNTPI